MRPRFWDDPRVVNKTPILTTFLLEGANVGQITRMWREGTAAGQSVLSWLLVAFALWLWWNFHRVCTPEQRWARRSAAMGITMNLCVVATVLFYRFH